MAVSIAENLFQFVFYMFCELVMAIVSRIHCSKSDTFTGLLMHSASVDMFLQIHWPIFSGVSTQAKKENKQSRHDGPNLSDHIDCNQWQILVTMANKH